MAPTRPAMVWMSALIIGVGGATVAPAAPTCQDLQGRVARCGTANAMPVGWSPTPAQRFDRTMAEDASPTVAELAAMIYVVGAVFALIALMPPFDGRNPEDWDEQEGDDRPR